MKDFIGVMDSGVGGLSVLREMIRLMPQEDFLFFGDSANAPYGTKSTDEVKALVLQHVRNFLEAGAKAIAIACNTATSAAVKDLRELYPSVPLVGIEPALKPAVIENPGGRVLVMATPMTIREKKFHDLLSRYGDRAEVIPLACPGLMEYVEAGKADTDEVRQFLQELLADCLEDPVTKRPLSAIVLGCTHYPFVAGSLREIVGDEPGIYDGSEGTARELKRRLREAGLLKADTGERGEVVIENSDPSPERIRLSEQLLYS